MTCLWGHLEPPEGGEALRLPGRPTVEARKPRPHRVALPRLGQGRTGGLGLARSSPRKWLTQRLRSVLGMWQMVAQRCLMDSGGPGGSPEPVSALSYFTPFSKMFATCSGSPQRAPVRAPDSGRPADGVNQVPSVPRPHEKRLWIVSSETRGDGLHFGPGL